MVPNGSRRLVESKNGGGINYGEGCGHLASCHCYDS